MEIMALEAKCNNHEWGCKWQEYHSEVQVKLTLIKINTKMRIFTSHYSYLFDKFAIILLKIKQHYFLKIKQKLFGKIIPSSVQNMYMLKNTTFI